LWRAVGSEGEKEKWQEKKRSESKSKEENGFI
jgi:hypothetical protein